MPVDPSKPRTVLVVHGVQAGPDDLNQDRLVEELIRSRIGNIPLPYLCQLYRYEQINVEAQKKHHDLLELIATIPVGEIITAPVMEMVQDVVISLENGSTAQLIRQGLRQAILDIFNAGNPCYILAHSLGSIYAFDLLNELIADGAYFDPSSRKSWPVQGLITIGSPIGLELFKRSGRNAISDFSAGDKWFRWLNVWDPNDPVVSGTLFGQQLSGYKIAENFLSGDPRQRWVIRDIVTDTGKSWLMAHTAYWNSAVVGDKLVDMMTS